MISTDTQRDMLEGMFDGAGLLSRTQAGHEYPAGRCKINFTTHSLSSPLNLLNQEAAREEGAHQSML